MQELGPELALAFLLVVGVSYKVYEELPQLLWAPEQLELRQHQPSVLVPLESVVQLLRAPEQLELRQVPLESVVQLLRAPEQLELRQHHP